MRNILFLLFFLFIYRTCYGQIPAIYIPIEKLSQIKIDGSLDDWHWVPEDYFLTKVNLKSIIKTENKECYKYWNCKMLFAWNDVKNWFYIIIITKDNVHKINSSKDNTSIEDNIEIAINPSNQGGDYYSKKFPRYYNVIKATVTASSSDNKQTFNINTGPTWLLEDKNYLQWKCSVKKNLAKNDSIEVIYEIGFSLLYEWSEMGPSYCKKHSLKNNDVIGLAIVFNKAGEKKNKRVAQWITATGTYKSWYNNADDISKIKLLPSSDNSNLWDGISNISR